MILIRTSLDGIEGVALVNQSLRHRLECLAEPDYQAFSSRLLPKGTPLLGVRLPVLRKIARELARKDWHFYLDTASNDSFEEILLQGMVIGYADMPVDEPHGCICAQNRQLVSLRQFLFRIEGCTRASGIVVVFPSTLSGQSTNLRRPVWGCDVAALFYR